MDKQIKKNDELTVKIDRLGDNGEGIATENGVVIFVPFALPGEIVKIHIINDKKSFLIGKVIEFVKKNNDRVQSPCPYFYKCGGCDLQHMEYEKQLEFKRSMVENSLKKYAKIDVKIEKTIASDKIFRYRNKFAFPVQDDQGVIKIGMYQKNSHKIIPIDDCLLQSENTKKIIKLFREYMLENKISAYNEQTKKGDIKHIVVRESESSFLMTVVVTNSKFNKFAPLIEKLKTQFSSFGITKNVNNLNNNVIFGKIDEMVYGFDNLKLCNFKINYEVNNRSFLQINDYIKNLIYQKIIDTVKEENNVVDAYSGAGLLSAIIAKNAKNVIGVEIEKEATKNADKLKKLNNLYNLTNKNGDCADIIPELAKELCGDFVIVVDPPRKGLDKRVVDAFLDSKPKLIVYLSCNPATLARDLAYLKDAYDIESVQPYDMFPQTANVETLVTLRSRENQG